MAQAGYSVSEAKEIKEEVNHYTNVMNAIKQASGEDIDLKQYDPFMRRLIDTYIGANPVKMRKSIPELPIIDLLIKNGAKGLDTIERNIRKIILNKTPIDPAYYKKLSAVLTALIEERKTQSESYDKFLDKHIQDLIELAQKTVEPGKDYPDKINTPAKKVLYNNLNGDTQKALQVFETIVEYKQDGWPDNPMKRKDLRNYIYEELKDDDLTDSIIEIAKNQPELT
ncbi:MAG: hypothetical protein BWY45_02691 [Euryarchaeota archaeon ADurb.Bin294]|nr:MAG: hypothetical protein BWY45_02691 [Euryarchaeota archaeon ADurb.Bin294]